MPLPYAVLKARPVGIRFGTGKSPHYQIHVVAGDTDYRIAVNIESSDGSEVEFLLRAPFNHPITAELEPLEQGLHKVPSRPGGIALDFIRGNLLQPSEMVPLPLSAAGPDNDLNEKLDHYVQRALSDEDAAIYAFGVPWGPEQGKPDQYFGFRPGNGIHDIHMNQGNPDTGKQAWFDENGPWQDGGLVLHFPGDQLWVAMFMKFQSQAWHTDDTTGKPLTGDVLQTDPPTDHSIPPTHVPTHSQPDGMVRIVAALVNDTQTPERETVTLLNTSDHDIDLSGWHLVDKMKQKTALEGTLARGGTLLVHVKPPMTLSNKGGIITLLDSRGVKIYGVAYTRDQARTPGLTIAFQ